MTTALLNGLEKTHDSVLMSHMVVTARAKAARRAKKHGSYRGSMEELSDLVDYLNEENGSGMGDDLADWAEARRHSDMPTSPNGLDLIRKYGRVVVHDDGQIDLVA